MVLSFQLLSSSTFYLKSHNQICTQTEVFIIFILKNSTLFLLSLVAKALSVCLQLFHVRGVMFVESVVCFSCYMVMWSIHLWIFLLRIVALTVYVVVFFFPKMIRGMHFYLYFCQMNHYLTFFFFCGLCGYLVFPNFRNSKTTSYCHWW